MAVNPTWRKRVGNDRLSREGSGSFNTMTVSGVNGLLSIVVSLWWWREKTSDTSPSLSSWKEAVTDVAYALSAARVEALSSNASAANPRSSKRYVASSVLLFITLS